MAGRGQGPVDVDALEEVLPPGETVGTATAALKPLRCRVPTALAAEDAGGAALRIAAGGEAVVRAFNSRSDHDEHGVLAPSGTGQIEMPPGTCWLVVRHTATAAASHAPATEHEEPAADGTLTLLDYRRHDPDEGAAGAVSDALRRPRLAVRLDDVLALGPAEAVAVDRWGTLVLALDVPWADVLAGGLGALAGIVGGASPLAVHLPAAARVRGTARIRARFTVVFARLANGRTRVAVKAGAACAERALEPPSAAVELADPREIERVLDHVASGLLAPPRASIADGGDGPEAEAAVARPASEAPPAGRSNAGGVRALQGAIAEAIAEMAAGRIAEGVEYELARLPAGTVLLQATLDREAVSRFHATLCTGDLAPLTSALAQRTAGTVLETFLQRRALEQANCWGFTLGIAPWAAAGRRRDALGRVGDPGGEAAGRASFLGLGSYDGRWLTDVVEWTADVRIERSPARSAARPEGPSLGLGFHLSWHVRLVRVERDELDALLDGALLWGVFAPDQAEDLRPGLEAMLGHTAEATVQLRIDDAPFRALLPFAAAGRAEVAVALAAALPWRRDSPGRSDPQRRGELYAPLWAYVLEHPDAHARALVTLAHEHLADRGHPQLAFLEDNYLRLTPTSSFVGLARVGGADTAAAWEAFRSGARLLDETARVGPPDAAAIERAYALMARAWAQPHHARALGAYLLGAAARAGAGDAVTRSLTIVAGDAGVETTTVVAAPAP